jgi:D-alanyl-lipoteichoic acid acyltransferase DltB (MBOAT superfamily)
LLNFYVNLGFFVDVAVAIVVFRLALPALPYWGRQLALIAMSTYFLSFVFPGITIRFVLAGYVIVVVAIGEAIAYARGRYKSLLIGIACTMAVSVLAAYKYEYLLELANIGTSSGWHLRGVQWIGLSYLTFRAIDYVLAMRSANKMFDRRGTNWLYACSFLTFFPAYVSGPINRFLPYRTEQGQAPTPMSFARVRRNVLRASLGVVKLLFFGKIARAYSLLGPMSDGNGVISVGDLAIGLYSYYLYLYFDFSGYCDAAIAVADFLEVRLPENFRYPFLASSPQDFWNRWHITLSHWMRDMVFFRLLRGIATRFRRVPPLAASMISVFITFTLVGAWHGDRFNWVLYGCYHGLALALHMIYRWTMEATCPDLYQRLLDSLVYRATATIVTFNFIAWGLLLTLPLDSALGILERVSLPL